MAARRLLIVMLVLLGLSTLAAALIPTRTLRDDEGTSSTITSETQPTTTGGQDATPGGRDLRISIEVGGEKVKVVPIEVGDQLRLIVNTTAVGLAGEDTFAAPASKADFVFGPSVASASLTSEGAPVRTWSRRPSSSWPVPDLLNDSFRSSEPTSVNAIVPSEITSAALT
jgi:hypothetical protein